MLGKNIPMENTLTRINSSVQDNPIALLGIKNDLRDMLDQIPQSWDAHTRLEYSKVALRTVILTLVVGLYTL